LRSESERFNLFNRIPDEICFKLLAIDSYSCYKNGIMSQHQYYLHIKKEAIKFASAHMTIFSDGSKEALHGHNYSLEVSLEVKSIDLKDTLSFSEVKAVMREICQEWDEKVLVQAGCPFFQCIKKDQVEVEFLLCQKRYVLPVDEVIFLEIDNVTSESLAKHVNQKMLVELKKLKKFDLIQSLSVKVEESPGQGGACVWRRS